MTVHELKCWPEYFEALVTDRKKFELRKDDRGFQVHDKLVIREWNPGTTGYTGMALDFEVTYILRDHEGLSPGWIIMGVEAL